MRHSPSLLLVSRMAVGAALCVASAGGGQAEEIAARRTAPSLGFLADGQVAASLPVDMEQQTDHPLLVRLMARWEEIEREQGVYDWSGLEPVIGRLHDAGYRVVLCLTGSNPLYLPEGKPPSPLEGSSMQRWVEFARSAVRSFGARVGVYEIWDGPATLEPAVYAFLLKNSALAVRAEARAEGAEVLLAEGALRPEDIEWQKSLWTLDVAPYIDILPVRMKGAEGDTVSRALEGVFRESVLHPPVPATWAYLEPPPEGPPPTAGMAAIRAIASWAQTALARVPEDPASLAEEARWIHGLHRALHPGFAPAPSGDLSFADLEGKALAGPKVLGRFVNEEDLSSLVVYEADASRGQAFMVLDVRDVRDAKILDPATAATYPSATGTLPGTARRTVGVLLRDHPMALSFRRVATAGLELPSERLEVQGTRKLTAEEIIAWNQQVQKVQDDRLYGWMARGRVDFHFKLAQAGSAVDVSMESNYFWERGGQLEWEQTDYYINGNHVGWKKIPELPLIQPEKVVTLPLDLTLDKTYSYRLEGEDRVADREAYVLAFEPGGSNVARSLYRGRVWIDKQSFVRLQVSVVQIGLEAPVLSNEEKDVYEPVSTSEGETFWMLSKVEGQQLWTAGGRNFVVQRELTFRSFEINPPRPEFEERRKSAYASEHQMLRDTDKGFRYLEKNTDGSRTVKETVDTSQLFAAGGLYKDSSIDSVVPLGGVNYFNYNLGGKNIQVNAFFAGVIGFFNATQPNLFGRKIDAAVEATGFAIRRTDKVFQGDVEGEPERVRFRSQNVSLRVGVPAGQFVKFSLIGDLEFTGYSRDERTDSTFVLPQDHRLTTGTFQVEFNRKGYTLTASGSSSRRSQWEPWGVPDTSGGFPQFDPSHKTFTTWRASIFKEWYLPKFQKLRGELNYLDGSDLDRFSQFQFSFFGDTRLSGFSGTGVRFDRGLVARAGYAFNLFEVIRLDAALETARAEQKNAQTGSERFTGIGLSGSVVGPWKTIISLNYGRALASDIGDLEGKQEFLLVVLKLF